MGLIAKAAFEGDLRKGEHGVGDQLLRTLEPPLHDVTMWRNAD